jgi:hypothetical protein
MGEYIGIITNHDISRKFGPRKITSGRIYELSSHQTGKSGEHGKGRSGYARPRHSPSSCNRTRANARDSINTRLLQIPRVETP